MSINTTTRNATIEDLATMLQAQHVASHDFVASASALDSQGGVIHVADAEDHLSEEGVTKAPGVYRPTSVADQQLADATGIPVRYMRRMRESRPDLYDANVNGWLHGAVGVEGDHLVTRAEPDPRKFLLRTFSAQDGSEGILRAVLSDRYRVIDNLDVLMSVLAAVRESGLDVDVRSADLSERRMIVKLNAPAITALAPTLLKGYRSPFGDPDVDAARRFGNVPDDTREVGRVGNAPMLSAGIRITNSEVGEGALAIVPEVTVLVCTNGMVQTMDAMRKIHLGSRMAEEGPVKWSEETRQAQKVLVQRQTIDAVSAFLNPDYLATVVARIEAKAGDPLSGPVNDTVETVAKTLAWTEEEQKGILDHFIRGGQMTKGGVLNAVTSYSQIVASPDRADELDSSAMRVLDLA